MMISASSETCDLPRSSEGEENAAVNATSSGMKHLPWSQHPISAEIQDNNDLPGTSSHGSSLLMSFSYESHKYLTTISYSTRVRTQWWRQKITVILNRYHIVYLAFSSLVCYKLFW